MTGCSIENAASNGYGGAIGGSGPSACVLLNGVSFTNCTGSLGGSILYGRNWYGIADSPAYTIGPGCSVDGTVITSANRDSILPDPSVRYLINGSTISGP
jgi:hypothetical protein